MEFHAMRLKKISSGVGFFFGIVALIQQQKNHYKIYSYIYLGNNT